MQSVMKVTHASSCLRGGLGTHYIVHICQSHLKHLLLFSAFVF